MLKFIIAAIVAVAGILTLLWATNTWIDATARDAAPQSTPVTQTAPVPAAVAISPELLRLEVARDLAVIRNSVEQLANKVEELAAKQDQMSQNIVTLQAVEKDVIQERSSPPLSGPVSPPPRKKARRVAPRKLVEQSSSVPPPPAFRPQ
jgi:outer membrane murein-binding lipoprotein Lpp